MPMNLLLAAWGGIGIAFMLRFLVAVIHERLRAASRPASVSYIETQPLRGSRNNVVMINPRLNRKRTHTSGWRVVVFSLTALLLSLPMRSYAQSVEPPASAQEVRELRELVRQLQARVAQLEASHVPSAGPMSVAPGEANKDAKSEAGPSNPLSQDERGIVDYFRDLTINLGVDGYYGYNFNRPIGRVNQLRAYDVSSNNFSLNQANLIFEQAPNAAAGRRFGARLDLQFGQAAEAAQGSPASEPRPQVYRPLWQAYGRYVAPIGSGLTVDFGKWASPLGIEGNYSKDQINYSRSYLFFALPFYHAGVRATYQFHSAWSLGYAIVNGVNQAEDFNGFKSQLVFINTHPAKSLSWNIVYYSGQEQAAVQEPPQPNGRLHIIDSNVTWNVNPKLTLAGEGDYFINRVFSQSAPAHIVGGAAYARYQLTLKAALAGRAEYLSDRGGLFSGATQALKETTLTYEYKVADGFLARAEWRRDFSNQPVFFTETSDALKKEQNTATLGLMWWWGRKQGSW
jgi:hypothetical protein